MEYRPTEWLRKSARTLVVGALHRGPICAGGAGESHEVRVAVGPSALRVVNLDGIGASETRVLGRLFGGRVILWYSAVRALPSALPRRDDTGTLLCAQRHRVALDAFLDRL